MTPDVLDLLCRHYGYVPGRPIGGRRGSRVMAPLTQQEVAAVAAAGDVQTVEHDDLLRRARQVVTQFGLGEVSEAFVAGVGGSALRGRQPLISYLWARAVPDHPMQGSHRACMTCDLQASDSVDVTEERVRLHLGGVWNEMPMRYVIDLEDVAQTGLPAPSAIDRQVLANVLEVADSMPPSATPSNLGQQLRRAGVTPGENKYSRYGILQALAEVGVLPNDRIAPMYDRFSTLEERIAAHNGMRGSSRSDIVLPLAAWRGARGVDWTRAQQLFAIPKPTESR